MVGGSYGRRRLLNRRGHVRANQIQSRDPSDSDHQRSHDDRHQEKLASEDVALFERRTGG